MSSSYSTRGVWRFFFWCAVPVAIVAAVVVMAVALVVSLAAYFLFFVTLVSIVSRLSGGGEFDVISPTLRMDYVNNTDSVLCLYTSTHSDRTRCGEPLQPDTKTVLLQDCYTSAWNILDEESTGDEVYFRVARCEEWFEAGHTITVDREGDRFVITDGFPGPATEP